MITAEEIIFYIAFFINSDVPPLASAMGSINIGLIIGFSVANYYKPISKKFTFTKRQDSVLTTCKGLVP